MHGERTQTYFNVAVHMTMVSEAWEATDPATNVQIVIDPMRVRLLMHT